MEKIRFGTSGWRGVLAKDLTFETVAIVVQGICDYLKEMGTTAHGLIIGYDSRFLGENFAELARNIITHNNIRVFYSTRETPTPVLSFAILSQHLDGAINFTASHNLPEYNGIKFTPSWGGPALPETTRMIETKISDLIKRVRDLHHLVGKPTLATQVDFRPDYFNHLRKLIDFETIKRANISAICDPLWGAGRGYLNGILSEEGVKIKTLHNFRDPYFGGQSPDPSAENLTELAEELGEVGKDTIGLALDGDGDRFGILDMDGSFVQPNYILSLLLKYLIKTRHYPDHLGVARSVATTHLIDRIALSYNLPLYETPVGFKYIGDLLTRDQIILGGEESGGMSIRNHLPEKDGILGCLLAMEMIAREGKGFYQQLASLYESHGTVRCRRLNFTIDDQIAGKLRERLKNPPPVLGNRKIIHVKTLDGTKIFLDNDAWVMFREAGTEPLLRVYIEAGSDGDVDYLTEQTREFINH